MMQVLAVDFSSIFAKQLSVLLFVVLSLFGKKKKKVFRGIISQFKL